VAQSQLSLEVTDRYPEPIESNVRTQRRGRRGTNLDRMNRCGSASEVLGRLAGPRTDFEDVKTGRQRLEQRIEQLDRVRGPHTVIDFSGLVKREPHVVGSSHSHNLPSEPPLRVVGTWDGRQQYPAASSTAMTLAERLAEPSPHALTHRNRHTYPYVRLLSHVR
jgi:hypothetical protein